MRKFNILCMGLLLAGSLQAQTITELDSFEEDFLGDYDIVYSENKPEIQSFGPAAADNPNKTGINKTDRALKISSKPNVNIDWWNNDVSFTIQAGGIAITDDNRYLHIMHYRTNALDGWMIYGDIKGDKEIARGVAAPNRWVDIVIDLKAKSITQFENLRLLVNTNWNGVLQYAATDFYFDEIVLSSSAEPRSIIELIEGNSILNFEDQADTDSKVLYTANGTLDMFLANPLPESVSNTTGRCASFTPKSSGGNWYDGITLNFFQYVPVTATNKYLHMMMRRDVVNENKTDVTYCLPGSDNQITIFENGKKTGINLTTEWVDYVSPALAPGLIGTINFKFNNSKAYLDELWIDGDPNPRMLVSGMEKNVNMDTYLVGTLDNLIKVKSNNDKVLNVNIYNMAGALYFSASSTAVETVVNSGIYIVVVDGEAQKVVVR